MAPPLGNTYAKKLITNELKKEVFDSYLAHLAKGKSKKSWWFDNGEVSITWETMDNYIRDESDVFSSVKINIAKSQGYNVWEQVAEDSAKGINKDANTASLQMVMRNKFGWDKEDSTNKESKATLVEKLLDKMDKLDDSDQTR